MAWINFPLDPTTDNAATIMDAANELRTGCVERGVGMYNSPPAALQAGWKMRYSWITSMQGFINNQINNIPYGYNYNEPYWMKRISDTDWRLYLGSNSTTTPGYIETTWADGLPSMWVVGSQNVFEDAFDDSSIHTWRKIPVNGQALTKEWLCDCLNDIYLVIDKLRLFKHDNQGGVGFGSSEYKTATIYGRSSDTFAQLVTTLNAQTFTNSLGNASMGVTFWGGWNSTVGWYCTMKVWRDLQSIGYITKNATVVKAYLPLGMWLGNEPGNVSLELRYGTSGSVVTFAQARAWGSALTTFNATTAEGSKHQFYEVDVSGWDSTAENKNYLFVTPADYDNWEPHDMADIPKDGDTSHNNAVQPKQGFNMTFGGFIYPKSLASIGVGTHIVQCFPVEYLFDKST